MRKTSSSTSMPTEEKRLSRLGTSVCAEQVEIFGEISFFTPFFKPLLRDGDWEA